jgi:hypothetical protein
MQSRTISRAVISDIARDRRTRLKRRLRWALSICAACLALPQLADATPVSSGATITYLEALDGGPTAGIPTFGPGGELLSAGSGHPTFTIGLVPQQVTASGNIFSPPNPFPALTSVAVPGAIGTGTAFAGGAVGVTAFNFGPSVSTGLFYAPFALGASAVPGYAKVDSPANAVVQNDLGFAQLGYALSQLGVVMRVPHSAPGYVAVSLTASIDGAPLAPIVLATDGVGPLPDVATGGLFSALFFIGYDPFFDLDYFLAYGFSLSPLLTVPNGNQLTVDATISGVADPGGSFFDVFVELDPNLLPRDAPVIVRVGTIPEPATLAMLGLGLAALGFMRRRLAVA